MALKSYRFALGTADHPVSGIWHLWVQEDDVHLDVHATQQPVAFTAYRTGRWRIAVGDAVSRWTRPKEFRPGWIQGPDLLVPGSPHPFPIQEFTSKPVGPIEWLAPPAAGTLARFRLFFAMPRSAENSWRPGDTPGTSEIVQLALRTAGSLYLCRRDEPNDESDSEPATPAPVLIIRISADQAGVPSLRESYVP